MAPNIHIVDIPADDGHACKTAPGRVMDERIMVGFCTIQRYNVGGLHNTSNSLRRLSVARVRLTKDNALEYFPGFLKASSSGSGTNLSTEV